jgi:hypothetical protein
MPHYPYSIYGVKFCSKNCLYVLTKFHRNLKSSSMGCVDWEQKSYNLSPPRPILMLSYNLLFSHQVFKGFSRFCHKKNSAKFSIHQSTWLPYLKPPKYYYINNIRSVTFSSKADFQTIVSYNLHSY